MSRGIVVGSGGSAIQVGDVTFDDKHLEVNKGYLICDGSSIDPVEYEELFNILKPTSSSTTATLLKYPFTAYIRSGLKYGGGGIPIYSYHFNLRIADPNFNFINYAAWNTSVSGEYNTQVTTPSFEADAERIIDGETWEFVGLFNSDKTPYVPYTFTANPSNAGQNFLIYVVYTRGDPYEIRTYDKSLISKSATIVPGYSTSQAYPEFTFNYVADDALVILDIAKNDVNKQMYSLSRDSLYTIPAISESFRYRQRIVQDQQSNNYLLYGYQGNYTSTDLETWVNVSGDFSFELPTYWKRCIPFTYGTLVIGCDLDTSNQARAVFWTNIASSSPQWELDTIDITDANDLFLGYRNGKYRFVSNHAGSSSNTQINVSNEFTSLTDLRSLTFVKKSVSLVLENTDVSQNPQPFLWDEEKDRWIFSASGGSILTADWDFNSIDFQGYVKGNYDSSILVTAIEKKYGLYTFQYNWIKNGTTQCWGASYSDGGQNFSCFEFKDGGWTYISSPGAYVGGFYRGKYYIVEPGNNINVYHLFNDQG